MTTGCWISTGHGPLSERYGPARVRTSVLHVAPISWVATHKKSYQVCHDNINSNNNIADRNLLSASFAFHWMLVGFSCVRLAFLQFCFWKIAAHSTHSAHNKQRREQARPWLNCKPGSCRTWNKFEHCLHDQLTRCLREPTVVFRTHSLYNIHSLTDWYSLWAICCFWQRKQQRTLPSSSPVGGLPFRWEAQHAWHFEK